MERIYTICRVCSLALIAFAIIYIGTQQHQKPIRLSEGGPESTLALAKYMHMRYADPATGKVPFGGTYEAYQQLVARGIIPAQMRMERSGASSSAWQLVNDFFPSIAISMITYDPQHPDIFYFSTGEGWDGVGMAIGQGVFKSTDGGTIWAQLKSTDTSIFDYCQDIKVNPFTSDIYVATSSYGLMRSKDGGTTWHKVLGASPYQASANSMCNIAFTKNGGIFCTGGIFQLGGIYYSPTGDSGTWTKQTNGFPSLGIYRVQIATAPSNDSVAYAVACSTASGYFDDESGFPIKGIYKTTDLGKTWTTLPPPGGNVDYFAREQAWYDLALAVDPNNDSVVVAGGIELWRSRDGGQSWQQLADDQPDSTTGKYVHVDQHEIVFIGSDTVLFGNDGGIWESDNFTSANPVIFSRNYGYRVTQFYQAGINPDAGSNFIFGGTQDNGSPAMQFSGISNYFDLSWADGGYCAINYNNPGIIYTTSNELIGMYRLTNGDFSTRDTIANPYLPSGSTEFVNPLAMDPNNPEILYMASNAGLWRLTNASTAKDSDWTQACKGVGTISAIGISKSQPNTVYIGTQPAGAIFRIVNCDTTGATYVPINCDPNKTLPQGSAGYPIYTSSIEVDPNNVNHVFVVYSNYNVNNIWETHNATSPSAVWTPVDGDLPNLPINDVFNNPADTNVCYAATDLGVFYTNQLNGDSTKWLSSNAGLANVRAEMFKYRPVDSTIIVATYGRGIFQSKLNAAGAGNYALTWTERGSE